MSLASDILAGYKIPIRSMAEAFEGACNLLLEATDTTVTATTNNQTQNQANNTVPVNVDNIVQSQEGSTIGAQMANAQATAKKVAAAEKTLNDNKQVLNNQISDLRDTFAIGSEGTSPGTTSTSPTSTTTASTNTSTKLTENSQFMPASATRQTPAIDYKGFMHTVPHAASGTNQPDVCPAQVGVIINSGATRDTGEETNRQKWEPPEFAQFKPGELNAALMHGKVGPTPRPENFNSYNGATVDDLKEHGQENQKDPLFMGVPNCTMPMRCGYTITNPLNANGVDVGYAGGGSTGGAAGG
jgi:hypothetical protein